ncbi:MAG: adenosylcobinamide-GDP ribazoletransferase [Methanobrevibacter sp.]|jgi:adenosylcobinamide-GDP ribazoletransferase|nr:adenosylcobinamide-GDP ribazoletransferase [Candidatus Methanoflexus mossambicus]
MEEKFEDNKFKEEKSYFKSFLGLLSFSTIIPINVHTTINDMAKLTWLWPIISIFTGIIGVIIAYLTTNILNFNPILTAAIVYGFLIWINGFNHLDGLMDFGDAIMAHGTPEKKIAIMKDLNVGTGAIALFFIISMITVFSIYNILSNPIINHSFGIIFTIIIGEMGGKIGLLTTCLSSKSANDGLGKPFIENINPIKYLLSLIIPLIVSVTITYIFGFSIYLAIFGILGGILAGGLVSYTAKKHFKIANGDVLGASNEIGRMFSFIFILIAINLF